MLLICIQLRTLYHKTSEKFDEACCSFICHTLFIMSHTKRFKVHCHLKLITCITCHLYISYNFKSPTKVTIGYRGSSINKTSKSQQCKLKYVLLTTLCPFIISDESCRTRLTRSGTLYFCNRVLWTLSAAVH